MKKESHKNKTKSKKKDSKKAKKHHINPNNKKTSKKPNFEFDEYLNTITMQMFPSTKEHKQRFFTKMVLWARDDEDALHIYQFLDKENIHPDTVLDWVSKDKTLKALYDRAKRHIGYRREIGALKKKFDAATATYTLPQYCNIWRDEYRARAALKQKDSNQQQPVTVVIEPYK